MAIKYELFYLQSRETMSLETRIKTPLHYFRNISSDSLFLPNNSLQYFFIIISLQDSKVITHVIKIHYLCFH